MIDKKFEEEFDKRTPFKLSDGVLMAFSLKGSHTHGLNGPDSDKDYVGVVMPPASYVFGIYSITRQKWQTTRFVIDECDCLFYSFQHYMGLLYKNNPDITELLWVKPEFFVYESIEFTMLRDVRNWFNSKKAIGPLRGIVKEHFRRMTTGKYEDVGEKRRKLIDQFGYDTADASHMIRMINMGSELFETGKINVFRTHDAEFLKDIKKGKYKLNEIITLKEIAMNKMEEAYEKSYLPYSLDEEMVDMFTQSVILKSLALRRV